MFKKMMNLLMLTCTKATELISVKRYRKLTAREKVTLKIHLATCNACKSFHHQSEFIDAALSKLTEEELQQHNLPEERKKTINEHIHTHLN